MNILDPNKLHYSKVRTFKERSSSFPYNRLQFDKLWYLNTITQPWGGEKLDTKTKYSQKRGSSEDDFKDKMWKNIEYFRIGNCFKIFRKQQILVNILILVKRLYVKFSRPKKESGY